MLQQTFFVEWLESIEAEVKADNVRKLKLDRLTLKWRDHQNKDDCCVYAMRHMETYFGQSMAIYRCGLVANSVSKNTNSNFY